MITWLSLNWNLFYLLNRLNHFKVIKFIWTIMYNNIIILYSRNIKIYIQIQKFVKMNDPNLIFKLIVLWHVSEFLRFCWQFNSQIIRRTTCVILKYKRQRLFEHSSNLESPNQRLGIFIIFHLILRNWCQILFLELFLFHLIINEIANKKLWMNL